MSIIYIYSKRVELSVSVDAQEVALKVFNSKWKYFRVDEKEFVVKFDDKLVEYNIQSSGNFAIYKQELIQIDPSPYRLLLVTDINNTIFNLTEEGLQAHLRFIHFWIKHQEFNGSKLVYNTAWSLIQYNVDADKLYEPDLLIASVSNYVYKFDDQGNGVLQESFNLFVEDFADPEWDSKILNEVLNEKFPTLNGTLSELNPFDIFYLVPNHILSEISNELIEFVKNRENSVVNGRCFKGKIIVSTQGFADKVYLEVLPKFGGKGLGVKYAQQIFGFVDSETIVAGDSLNDKNALKCNVQGVIVKNSEELLLKWFNKRERPNVYFSNFKFADAVVDFIMNKYMVKQESTIFIHSTKTDLIINETQPSLQRFKEKWSVFNTNSLEFTVKDTELTKYSLEKHGRYAIYNNKLISISKNLKSILLVTDLDNTIFNSSPEGLIYYSNFIEFWITHFEFNGSFLVYNSGRDYKQFVNDAYRLFLGDLHQLCLGNFAYVVNKNLELIPDTGFEIVKESGEKHDWDSQILFETLKERFGILNEHLKVMFDTYFLLLVPKHIVDQNLPQIRELIKNKENCQINGRVFHGKVRMLIYGMEDLRYLEIIPLFLGKNVGVKYAQKKFSFADENTIAAGDSLNDKDALKLPVNGIAMCNSEETLINWLKRKNRNNLVMTTEKYAYGLQIELGKTLYFN